MTSTTVTGPGPLKAVEPSAGLTLPATRFPRQLVASNFLDRLQAVSDKTKVTIQQVQQDFQVRRLGYHGDVKRDPQYEITLSFSDNDGQSFSDPLVAAEGNRIFQLKAGIAQYQADPLLSGFALTWGLPTGWSFTDGLIDGPLYEEAVSNPLIVTRTILSPANPQPAAFVLVIVEKFR